MSYATWDIETTIGQRFKRKATPFGGINWAVTHAFKKPGGPVTEVRFGAQPPGAGWLVPVLADIRLLVGFNIKFDLLHALQDKENLEAWMSYVAGGGTVWDCQLAEYLLEGMTQKNHMLSLDEVAPRYGGNVKVDEVKALWNAGINTHLIDPELLTRYLCGGNDEHGVFQLGDIENTEKIALGQIARARECGQLKSIMLNMGSLLCTIEMERNGMFIDVDLGKTLADKLRVKIEEVREVCERFMPVGMPFKFKWTSRFHKSALIFGGVVKYERREYQQVDGTFSWLSDKPTQAYAQKDEVFVTVAEDRPGLGWCDGHGKDHPIKVGLMIPLEQAKKFNVAVVRFAGGKNTGEVKTKKVKVNDLEKPKSRMGDSFFTFPGFTKPNKKWESADEGVYSSSAEVIEELGVRGIPFLKALAELQACTKDLSTYYIVTDEETGESKGMLSLVDEHGFIHHKINHTSTVTARFSSSDPNLQNIPKEKKSQVKLVFVSRFPGGKIIQSDFTALEIYIQAILTKCAQLILDLKAGLDMHCLRLAAKEGLPYEQVLLLARGNDTVLPEPEWVDKRTGSKEFSFQRAYGAGPTAISESTGIPKSDVEALIAADNERYPEIEPFYDAMTDEVKANRKPTGIVVPHPDVPGKMCHLGQSFSRAPDGKLYAYIESPSPEYLVKRGITASFSPTELKNYIVQGSGGEWAKAAMWLAIRAFYARRNFDHFALLVNQVHDAVYADAAPAVAFEAAALLHACMEAASDFMEYYFSWHIPVPVPSETSWGANMMEELRIPGVKDRAKEFRKELRALYMGGYVPSFATQKQDQL
jgi:DNA polymerase I-like protein with 3'-5' exonuclease and polymerase domains